MSVSVVFFLAIVVAYLTTAEPLQQGGTIAFQFVGSGFHQQFQVDVSLETTLVAPYHRNVTVEVDLPRAYFVDIAEATQSHVFTAGAGQLTLKDMSSQYIFDIEAPIFKIPYTTNKVTTVVELSSSTDDASSSGFSLLFPIHTRYEEVDTERSLDWAEFFDHIPSYTTRCIERQQVSGSLTGVTSSSTVQELVSSTKSACVEFPRGILAQLPVVYWLTMGLLTAGAVLVIALVR